MSVELLLVAICIFLCAASLVLFGYGLYSHQRIKELSDKARRLAKTIQHQQSEADRLQAEANRLRKINDALAFEIGKMQSEKSALLITGQEAEQRIEKLLDENRKLGLQIARLESSQNRKAYVVDESGFITTLESWRESKLR